MRSRLPPQSPADLRAERELQLEEFIAARLDQLGRDSTDQLLIVARSPSSPVISAVFKLSAVLPARRIGARIVMMTAAEGERWTLEFAPEFLHETRLATDPRVLDAHEQLVVGTTAVWFGDSMRRDPEKRDAFTMFADDAETARRSRATFDRLWAGCRPLYRNDVAAQQMVAAPVIAAAAETQDAALAQDVLATLNAWRPTSRH